jgi:hypothetical protein
VVAAGCCAAQNSSTSSPSAPPQAAEQPQTIGPQNSVAAAVSASKSQKAGHAKRVFTDDDVSAPSTGPFPRLKMDGLDNTDVIIAEIGNFKKTHTPEETEQAVHDWFDEYDSQLFTAIQDNQNRTILMQENQANAYELCQQGGDYEHCVSRQRSEAVGARSDQQTMARNNALIHRLQNALQKVRNGLGLNGLRYPWFKVRTTNNIDSV